MRVITDHTPARAFHTVATQLTTPSRAVIDTSHLTVRRPLHYQATPVTHVQVFTWLPHSHPASIVTCSYNGTTTAHFLTDQAIPGLDQLPTLWEQAASKVTTGR